MFERTRFVQGWIAFQTRLADGLTNFAQQRYRPLMLHAIEYRYVTASIALAALIIVGGLLASGRVSFQFFPPVEGDRVYATLTMPEGVPVEMTSDAISRLENAAFRLQAELDAERPPNAPSMVQAMFTSLGRTIDRGGGPPRPETAGQSHFGEVAINMPPFDTRGDISVKALSDRWRELAGPIPDAVALSFSAAAFTTGEAINFRLTGRDVNELREMAAELRGELTRYSGVYDISDSFRAGKQEIKLELTPAARTLGLTMNDLASQVRQAFMASKSSGTARRRRRPHHGAIPGKRTAQHRQSRGHAHPDGRRRGALFDRCAHGLVAASRPSTARTDVASSA